MGFLTDLQHRLGFTGNEIRVILFLSLTLLAGTGIRWLRSDTRASGGIRPAFDYSRSDSEFSALSHAVLPETTAMAGSPFHPAPPRKPQLPPGAINLNAATKQQLMLLPGIGASIAERIVVYRSEHGPFESVEDLTKIKGIGVRRLEAIRPFIAPPSSH